MLMAALELMQGLAEMPVGCVKQSHGGPWGGLAGWRGDGDCRRKGVEGASGWGDVRWVGWE